MRVFLTALDSDKEFFVPRVFALSTCVLIKFKFQLNEQYFIPIVMLLYRFRAPLRPSLTNLPTAWSPKETDIEPDVVDIQRST